MAARLIILSIVFILGSCSTRNSSFCGIYQPVPTLYEGTDEQRILIDMNNAVFLEQCM